MSRCTRIFTETEAGWVSNVQPNCKLVDPTPLAANEADLGMDGINPIRKPVNWRLMETVDVEGEPTQVAVPWVQCKVAGQDIVKMDAAEQAERDAYDEAQKQAKEQAEQDAKPQKVKNREKKARDILTALGFAVPVPQDDIDVILPTLLGQIQALLAENKTKDAVELQSQAVALLALWVTLGDDIYAPYLGDGGVDE